jgi:hypothetical protein
MGHGLRHTNSGVHALAQVVVAREGSVYFLGVCAGHLGHHRSQKVGAVVLVEVRLPLLCCAVTPTRDSCWRVSLGRND